LIVQGVLALTFHTCIYHSLIRLTWLTYSFSITLLPYYSTGYNALYYIIFIHRWTASTFFTQTFSFPLLPPIIPSDRPTNAILFSLSPSHYIYILYVNISIYIYDHISICVNIYLIGLACTYEGKHATFDLLSLASPVSSIYCKQHNFIHLYGWIKLHCAYIPHFLNPFISCGASTLLPKLCYCEAAINMSLQAVYHILEHILLGTCTGMLSLCLFLQVFIFSLI
jgi:hypothetical protein